LPVFRSNKAIEIARDVKALLGGRADERREFKRVKNKIRSNKQVKKLVRSKRQELQEISDELRAARKKEEIDKLKERKGRTQQVIFRLERELLAAKGGSEGDEPATGALPDFLIIGARKSGTTFLYNLLSLHPLVEPAASKELHYFDVLFEQESIEWYRGCFPQPRVVKGRRTITGEASPSYLSHPLVPERAARVVPKARLIALLRNPVDRAYSHYQQVTRLGREPRTFEEAIGVKEGMDFAPENGGGLDDGCAYLSRGVYMDQLLRWSRFYPREQTLVLKSEDFYGRTTETLKIVLGFLGLPDWEPKDLERVPRKRNKGKSYDQEMDPATRRRLEKYFEPHNRRLYDYLGVDFGW
jgi:hypothetical protein